ncbi:hypothetical protein [Croceibacterium ferulae]|uniref:hypothetical protein n=1 Tax=Croceibacterium ferulae TaxID=1854641 RepID=UPI000F878BA8|nr:hypothetical protein [Croceibacterium ferulae]
MKRSGGQAGMQRRQQNIATSVVCVTPETSTTPIEQARAVQKQATHEPFFLLIRRGRLSPPERVTIPALANLGKNGTYLPAL